MAKRNPKASALELPQEIQEAAKDIIERAFKLFADQTQQFTDNIARFGKKREEIRRKIQDGARRTSGRIV